MKKFILLLMVYISLVSFCACSKKDNNDNDYNLDKNINGKQNIEGILFENILFKVDLENVEISTKVKNNNEIDFYLENFQMIIKDKNGNILTTLNQTVEENLAANSEVTYNNKYTLNLINATSIEYNVNINVHE